MKIGIIGSGNMGRALGVRLAQLGHTVYFGARRHEQAVSAATLAGPQALCGSTDDAARFGEVLIWTMREPVPAHVLGEPQLLDGKIVIELNNRSYEDAKTGAQLVEALAERLQASAPLAKVVKAFNTIAMETFDTSADRLRAAHAQTFIAGNDATAKEVVSSLARELGFEPVDLGGMERVRTIEAMGDIIRLVMIDGQRGGRAHLSLTMLPERDLNAIGARQSSAYG